MKIGPTRKLHPLRFHRYAIADPGFRVVRNRYTDPFGSVTIGFAVAAGRYAYAVKWADAQVTR